MTGRRQRLFSDVILYTVFVTEIVITRYPKGLVGEFNGLRFSILVASYLLALQSRYPAVRGSNFVKIPRAGAPIGTPPTVCPPSDIRRLTRRRNPTVTKSRITIRVVRPRYVYIYNVNAGIRVRAFDSRNVSVFKWPSRRTRWATVYGF